MFTVLLAASPPKDSLTPRERAACNAYLAELQVLPGQDPIVDPGSKKLRGRFRPPAELMHPARSEALIGKIPDRPPVLVFTGVVERDGHITHGKAVVPSGNPKLDEHVVLKFLSLHFRKPGLLNDKPVRSFFVWKGTDASFLGGT